MTTTHEPMVCLICHRALDYYENLDGTEPSRYQHTAQDRANEDHDPVPVREGVVPLRGRCDFCNRDEPAWIIPATTFVVVPGNYSEGDWAACDGCVPFITGRRWRELVAKRVDPRAELPRAVRAGLLDLYSRLATNIVGPARPIGDA